jgi:hypothetical protein
LEYQGEQHYFEGEYFMTPLETQQKADQTKRKFASQLGVTLISVPFWWDMSSNSIAATVQYFRPDIKLQEFAKDVPPISMDMPPRLRKHIPKDSR